MPEDTHRLFATDYDGTLAFEGRVTEATRAALAELRAAGWRLALVTGRILADLQAVYGQTSDFDYVVAENGALLHRSNDGSEQMLAEPPPGAFVEALRALMSRPWKSVALSFQRGSHMRARSCASSVNSGWSCRSRLTRAP